jgi:predicted transcriptional regulator
MNAKLKDIIDRAETWPPEAQEELAQIALEIEAQLKEDYSLTPQDLEAIDRGLQDAAEGRYATNVQVESVFANIADHHEGLYAGCVKRPR